MTPAAVGGARHASTLLAVSPVGADSFAERMQPSFTRAEEMPGARFAHARFPLTGIMGAICSSTRSPSVTFTGIRYEG
jgi:hypothetical protein